MADFFARLGAVLYGLAWLIGGPFIALAAWGALNGGEPSALWAAGLFGAFSVIVGRLVYYVLSGN